MADTLAQRRAIGGDARASPDAMAAIWNNRLSWRARWRHIILGSNRREETMAKTMQRSRSDVLARTEAFCARFELRVPILLAPMGGACPASLSIAVANAGGLGACGALLMKPEAIAAWAGELRDKSNGAFQLNLWIPDPPPRRDTAREAE